MKILINFYAGVSEKTVNDLINFVTQQIATQKPDAPIEEIVIQVSSSGGSSDHGMLAYNFLKQLSIKKTTIGMGNVDSAAVMIFSAGDKRIATPNCRFTLHESLTTVQGVFNGTKLHEIARLNEQITKDYCKVIASVTGKKQKEIEKRVREGHVILSDEAKKYGLVQIIQDTPYLPSMQDLHIMTINNPPPPPPRPFNQGESNV